MLCNIVCAFHLGFLATKTARAHITWCRIFSAPYRVSYSSSRVVPLSARLVSADTCLEYHSPWIVICPAYPNHYTLSIRRWRSGHTPSTGFNVILRTLSMQRLLPSKYYLPKYVYLYIYCFQWVTVLYWPQATQNTACIPQATGVPLSALPPGIAEYDPTILYALRILIDILLRTALESPNVYVIFPSISANDGCTQIGKTHSSITTMFAPSDLSTIDSSGATKVFDFGDLPCGPPGMEDPNYAPLIAPPSFIFNELDNGAFASCIPGLHQGVDPPRAVQAGNGVSGPGSGHPHRPKRRAPANAPAVPTHAIR